MGSGDGCGRICANGANGGASQKELANIKVETNADTANASVTSANGPRTNGYEGNGDGGGG